MSEVLSTNKIMLTRTSLEIAKESDAKQRQLKLAQQDKCMNGRMNSRIFHLYYSHCRYVRIDLLTVINPVAFCVFLIIGITGSYCALIPNANSLNLKSCPDYDTFLWAYAEKSHCRSPEKLHCQTDEDQNIRSMCHVPANCGEGTYAKLDVASKTFSCKICPADKFQPVGQDSYKYKRPSCERNRTPCSQRRGTSQCEKGNATTDDKCYCDKSKGYISQPLKGCICFVFDDPCTCSHIDDLCREGETIDEENNCIPIRSTTPNTTQSTNSSSYVTQTPMIRSTTEPVATPGDSTLSTGATVGIVIAILAVFVTVAVAVILFLRKRKICCFENQKLGASESNTPLNKGPVSETESTAVKKCVTNEEMTQKRPTEEQCNGVRSELYVSSPSNGYLSNEVKERSSPEAEPLIGGSIKPAKIVFKSISVNSDSVLMQIGNRNTMNKTAVEECDGSNTDDMDSNLEKDSDQTHTKTVVDENDTMLKKHNTSETCPETIVSMDEPPTTHITGHSVPPKLPRSDHTHRKMASFDADETKLKQVVDMEETCPESLVSMNLNPKPTVNGSMLSPKDRLDNTAVDTDETKLKRSVNTPKPSSKSSVSKKVQPRKNKLSNTDSDQTGLIV